MGNAQKKSPGRGEEGGSQHSRPGTPGYSRAARAQEPPGKKPEVNGTHPVDERGREGEESPAPGGTGAESCNLDAPAGALPPPLARLKNEGNLLFRRGQFGDALDRYTQAIEGCERTGEGD